MIQNYFGEETIWKLLANNPYEKNNAQGITLMYRATSLKENENIVSSFLRAIPRKNLTEIVTERAPENWFGTVNGESWGFTAVAKIRVKNVFGNESEVIILNM